jgi:hypothetical protein
MAGKPLADCPNCSQLAANTYDDLMDGSRPHDAIVALLGFPPPGGAGTVCCPTCGTLYEFEYDCGFMEHDISLRRISPTEAGAPIDVERCTAELAHANADTRDYAALCLASHHVARDDHGAVIELLRHDDATVKIRSIVTVIYSKCDVRPYLAAFIELLFDADPSVRGNAARIAHYHMAVLRECRAEILDGLKRQAGDGPLPPDAASLLADLR